MVTLIAMVTVMVTVMAILTAMATIPFDIITTLKVGAVIIMDQDIGPIIGDEKKAGGRRWGIVKGPVMGYPTKDFSAVIDSSLTVPVTNSGLANKKDVRRISPRLK